MPSIAGFYASHETCTEWVRCHRPELHKKYPMGGAKLVCMEMRSLMGQKGLDCVLQMDWFPTPGPRRHVNKPVMCLIAISRGDARKTYLLPKGDERSFALKAKECIEEDFGLKLDDWTVIWYRTSDPDFITEFVTPEMD
ncbi:hypothetical protein BDV93DRAFT_522450 [Ceratobasidium sp. AG-I]|nr:hypothetical protein BDV93DRAFT_522450 [Ceratobasidium sp. AG-I]